MSKKVNVLDRTGLSTLIDYMKQVKKTSDGNSSDVSDLRSNLQELASRLTAVLTEVGDCIESLDNEKAYIAVRKEFSLPVGGWVADNNAGNSELRFKQTLAVGGATVDARIDAVLSHGGIATADACGMSPMTESVENGVIFRCRTIPQNAIVGQLYITQGATEQEIPNNKRSGE